MKNLVSLSFALLFLGCGAEPQPDGADSTRPPSSGVFASDPDPDPDPGSGKEPADSTGPPATTEIATLAGGCFWCIEAPFEKVPGVLSAVSGYTGGHVANPTYKQVSSGRTGHTEAVQITFDPSLTSYEQILDYFWQQFDPTDVGGSFADRGSMYRSAIFTHSDEQRRIAEASRAALETSERFDVAIATEIAPLDVFYPAEEVHQNYYKKNPERYEAYRRGSGRAAYIERNRGGD